VSGLCLQTKNKPDQSDRTLTVLVLGNNNDTDH